MNKLLNIFIFSFLFLIYSFHVKRAVAAFAPCSDNDNSPITFSVFSVPDTLTAGQPYSVDVQGASSDTIEPNTIWQINSTYHNITGVISDFASIEFSFCTIFNISCPYEPGNLTFTYNDTIPATLQNMTIQVNQTYSGMLLSIMFIIIIITYPHHSFTFMCTN